MNIRRTLAALTLLTLPLLASCEPAKQAGTKDDHKASPASPVAEKTPTEEPSPYASDLTADDFFISLKTDHKKCFGYGVGCNVTVEPEITYIGYTAELDPAKSYQITYQVSGDKYGPSVETATLEGDNLHYRQSLLSTSSSSTKVTAEITDVQETLT